MKVFGLFMSDLLEHTHDEFKLVLRHCNGRRHIRLLALVFGGARTGAARAGHSTLRTRALASGFFVILFQPLKVALVHVVGVTIVERAVDGFVNGVGGADIGSWVLPSIWGIELVFIGNGAGSVGDGDIGFGGFRFLNIACGSGTKIGGMVSMGRGG
jgi:hypothetical protein